ncbi:hypothetical protein [Actinocatenispora sera]|uniref:Uncharacterized protein n=1 Tax=Actinocatenispora sera TaxID=390989 RepID=A0A810L3V8_9ACTN|nr:hypothetical protein [Actinocatenispora sera]BCJ29659.1 hypothetical protein Asera_37670 [Actinocatenispora sera]
MQLSRPLRQAVAASQRARWQVRETVMASVPVRAWMRATYRTGKTVASMRYGCRSGAWWRYGGRVAGRGSLVVRRAARG